MAYYKFTAYTPFYGEEQDMYAEIPEIDVGGLIVEDTYSIQDYADEWATENANEWWSGDYEDTITEDEYYSEIGCNWIRISEEEFKRAMNYDM